MKEFTAYVIGVILALVIGFFVWKAERWVNWKFGYSANVEPRIEQLEKRIKQIELKQGDYIPQVIFTNKVQITGTEVFIDKGCRLVVMPLINKETK